MDRILHLPIYGPIPYGRERSLAWDLFQTDAAARLRDISLSSVPSQFSPHGMPASRFHHSAAVSHLAYLAAEHLELSKEEQNILVSAALLHDSGSAPFSHISEAFMAFITGNHHEAEVGRVLAEDESVLKVLDKYDVDAAEVLETITGKHPRLGKLLAGTIDLDNIDNSLHLLHSLTGITPLPYQPEHIINAYCWQDGELALDSSYLAEVLAWEDTREQLYKVLYQPVNLSAAASLYRAMEIAFQSGSLHQDFFRMSEGPALEYLSGIGNGVHSIIHSLQTWHHYPQIIRMDNQVVTSQLRDLAGDWKTRMQITDSLAEDLDLERHQVALYVGIDRGPKRITLPWQGNRSQAAADLFVDHDATGRIALFCSGRGGTDFNVVARRLLVEAIQEAKPDSDGHTFF